MVSDMEQKEGAQKEFYKETEFTKLIEGVVFSCDPNDFMKL
ncbi:MAG: hypothetical protein U9Q18_00220 [Caldisericota bacterium]|nr:hypothetical protein [Caldisericota bacterium]